MSSPTSGSTVPRVFTITGNASAALTTFNSNRMSVEIDGDLYVKTPSGTDEVQPDGSFEIILDLTGDRVVIHHTPGGPSTYLPIDPGQHTFHVYFGGNISVQSTIDGPTLVLRVQ